LPARGRSWTGLSLNEDDSAEVDSVCTCKCVVFHIIYHT